MNSKSRRGKNARSSASRPDRAGRSDHPRIGVPTEVSIRIGPYLLQDVIGRGGMGEVWAAEHTLQGRSVALKLLTSESARDPRYRLAFRNEIRNAAQLDHPNLVAVYDYGEVGDGDDPRFDPATPWLAMERVVGETLLPSCGMIRWPKLATVVKGLLHGLAHVHGRGVVHRDLKPANVMLSSATGTWQVKLSDFGLAHASEAGEEDHFSGGTPAYMAPEQFESHWRDYGPWTDLYALGCLLYALTTGRPPFGISTSFDESREAHHRQVVPALEPPVPVPAGFESWLRRLLEKDPARRYRRAADALHDFVALGGVVGEDADVGAASGLDGETLRLHTLTTFRGPSDAEPEPSLFTIGSSFSRPPPLPGNWRALERARAARHVQPGLSLLGVRAIPLVGRDAERDALWSALVDARRERMTQVVALHGGGGLGKSALASWFSQRAHEVGSAIVMRATHGSLQLDQDGLGGMAVRFLRCEELDADGLRARVHTLTGGPGDESDALMELLRPGSGDLRFDSPEELALAVVLLLKRATTERPVVMRLDDVHHSAETLRFVQVLLDSEVELPVVVVLTASDVGLLEAVDGAAVWEALCRHEQVRTVGLQPLAPQEHRRLLIDVLHLSDDLADVVERTTMGEPQFALQWVQDWVERDVLEWSDGGYSLREGVAPDPPDEVGTLWGRRMERLLDELDSRQQHALELAATLGPEVDDDEWRAVSWARGCTPSGELLDALLRRGLALGEGGERWAFAHEAAAMALRRRAVEREEWKSLNRVVADVLQARRSEHPGLAERVGRHRLTAGQLEEALEPLSIGLDRRITAGDYAHAEELLLLRQRALKELCLPAEDPRWGENELPKYHLASRRGDRDEARRVLAQLAQRAESFGWPVLYVWSRIFQARMARLRGDLDTVVHTLRVALEDAVAIGEPKLVAQARVELSDVEAVRGRLVASRSWAQSALQDFQRLDDLRGQARCWQTLGELDREAGAYDTAKGLLRRARSLYERTGYRWGRASVLNSEGDVARHTGELDTAESCYRRSASLFRAIGSSSVVYPEYNLALTLVARGRTQDARPVIERGVAHFARLEDGVGLANAHLALAACAAVEGQWLVWDEHLREGFERVAQVDAADEDTAWVAEIAGRKASSRGERTRAAAAFRLALDTWRVLGRLHRLRAVEAALARCR